MFYNTRTLARIPLSYIFVHLNEIFHKPGQPHLLLDLAAILCLLC